MIRIAVGILRCRTYIGQNIFLRGICLGNRPNPVKILEVRFVNSGLNGCRRGADSPRGGYCGIPISGTHKRVRPVEHAELKFWLLLAWLAFFVCLVADGSKQEQPPL